MNTSYIKGKACVLTIDADFFEKINKYAKAYDIKFPKVEALILELFDENGSILKSFYYGFEGSEEKILASSFSSTVESIDVNDEESYKVLIKIQEDLFLDKLIDEYLKEKHKK